MKKNDGDRMKTLKGHHPIMLTTRRTMDHPESRPLPHARQYSNNPAFCRRENLTKMSGGAQVGDEGEAKESDDTCLK
jgi:hypothetical protein